MTEQKARIENVSGLRDTDEFVKVTSINVNRPVAIEAYDPIADEEDPDVQYSVSEEKYEVHIEDSTLGEDFTLSNLTDSTSKQTLLNVEAEHGYVTGESELDHVQSEVNLDVITSTLKDVHLSGKPDNLVSVTQGTLYDTSTEGTVVLNTANVHHSELKNATITNIDADGVKLANVNVDFGEDYIDRQRPTLVGVQFDYAGDKPLNVVIPDSQEGETISQSDFESYMSPLDKKLNNLADNKEEHATEKPAAKENTETKKAGTQKMAQTNEQKRAAIARRKAIEKRQEEQKRAEQEKIGKSIARRKAIAKNVEKSKARKAQNEAGSTKVPTTGEKQAADFNLEGLDGAKSKEL